MTSRKPATRTVLTGGCLCGHIRFEAKGPPLRPHTCSCRMCQRHTGAPFAGWVEFAREDVAWVGPGGIPASFQSSAASARAFCPQCGSSLGALDKAPVVALLTGIFDKPGAVALRPQYHSFKSARPHWAKD